MKYSTMAISNVSGIIEFSVSFCKCLSCCIHVTHLLIVHSTVVVQQQQMLSQSIYLLHDVAQRAGSLSEMIGLIW